MYSHAKAEPCRWPFGRGYADGQRDDLSMRKKRVNLFVVFCVWLYEYNMNFRNHERWLLYLNAGDRCVYVDVPFDLSNRGSCAKCFRRIYGRSLNASDR